MGAWYTDHTTPHCDWSCFDMKSKEVFDEGWIASVTGIIGLVCLVTFYIDILTNLTDYYGTTEFILSQFIQAISTWSWLIVTCPQ
jgi:hypothetical protein